MFVRRSPSPVIQMAVRVCCAALALLASGSLGCGGPAGERQPPAGEPPKTAPKHSPPVSRQVQTDSLPPPIGERQSQAEPRQRKERRTLADLLEKDGDDSPSDSRGDAPLANRFREPPVDEAKTASMGIRKVASKHLVLYTNLAPAPDIDELPDVFDKAVLQWCEYFQVDPASMERWVVIGCLMQEKARFSAAGLLPEDLPPFPHGYSRGNQLWLYEQPSLYYRRHLMLHEGTHLFMFRRLGGAGPPWYMEGTAELLATHHWAEGRLQLGYFPKDRAETPQWGRIKMIQEEFAAGRGMMPQAIMAYDDADHADQTAYAWCWGLAAFLDNHPRYQHPFRELRKHVEESSQAFSQLLRDTLAPEWPELERQWQLFVVNMEYGYDIAREAVRRKPTAPLGDDGATLQIAADRGWQSSGLWLEAGVRCRIAASGRYQVANQPRIWWCEPNGVTIRYHRGRPLGMLMAAVCNDQAPTQGMTPLATPEPIGLEGEITPAASGALYLRINESAAGLADNSGELTVRVAAN